MLSIIVPKLPLPDGTSEEGLLRFLESLPYKFTALASRGCVCILQVAFQKISTYLWASEGSQGEMSRAGSSPIS